MIYEPAPLSVHGRADAAATIMSDHEDVLHLQHIDGELQYREIVRILRWREIGDVPVHEHLAGVETDDLIRRHAAVGATDPQVLGGLLAHEPLEETRVCGDLSRRPSAVVGFQIFKHGPRL